MELYSILEKFFINVPKLPQKFSQYNKTVAELNKNKSILNEFLQVLLFI